jgi:hypothetical protein
VTLFSSIPPIVICSGVGLALAAVVAFVLLMQPGRTLTFAFHKSEAKLPFLAIVLRILAGPAIVFADACRRLARRQESFGWLLTSTAAAVSWCFLNGLMIVSSVSLVS